MSLLFVNFCGSCFSWLLDDVIFLIFLFKKEFVFICYKRQQKCKFGISCCFFFFCVFLRKPQLLYYLVLLENLLFLGILKISNKSWDLFKFCGLTLKSYIYVVVVFYFVVRSSTRQYPQYYSYDYLFFLLQAHILPSKFYYLQTIYLYFYILAVSRKPQRRISLNKFKQLGMNE